MIDKSQILDEICRTAKENGGKPLGVSRFSQATGIAQWDWHGVYWARWSDALCEAGFEPNTLQGAYSDDFVLEKLISIVRELGKYPTMAEIRMKARSDSDLPAHNVFTRLGKKPELLKKLRAHCQGRSEYADVLSMCPPVEPASAETDGAQPAATVTGYVYLMKSGKFYKIGRTSAVGRREYELSILLPQKPKTIHTIETDDPAGIEAYWHRRFQDKRKQGEWFELRREDVNAFRRRKFM